MKNITIKYYLLEIDDLDISNKSFLIPKQRIEEDYGHKYIARDYFDTEDECLEHASNNEHWEGKTFVINKIYNRSYNLD